MVKSISLVGFQNAWKGKRLAQRWVVPESRAESKFEKVWAMLAFVVRQRCQQSITKKGES